MITSAITMRTTVAMSVLTLFMLTLSVLSVPASSEEMFQKFNSSSPSNNETTSTEATTKPATSSPVMGNVSDVSIANASPSQTPNTTVPTIATTKQLPQVTRAKPQTQSPSLALHPTSITASTSVPKSKIIIFVVLFAIVALMIIVGFIHRKMTTQSDEDSCVFGFLLVVRDRLRAAITNLEDRVGFQLLPRTKQGAEDADEDSEGGHEEEGCSGGVRDEEKGECKEEDSDTSDDYSSMEGDDLREKALRRQEEEEKKQSEHDDDDETSSGSEGCSGDVEGENGGDKTGGSEELVQINCPQEDDETANLCDVTAL